MLNLLFGLLRWARRPVPSGLVLTAIAILDPLGLSSASDRASRDMIQRVAAPFYDGADRKIIVVLFDDASLRALDLHWPPPYRATVLLLRKILCAQPRAVFVDLLFTHLHDDPAAFENLVLHLSGDRDCRSGTPVFLADLAEQPGFDVPDNGKALAPLRWVGEPRVAEDQPPIFRIGEHELLGPTRPVKRAPVNWASPEGVYPMMLEVSREEAVAWPPDVRIEHEGRHYLPTPAFALYRQNAPGVRPEDFDEPMVVQWGFVPQLPATLPENFERTGRCARLATDDRSPWSIAVTHFWWDLFHVFAPQDDLRQSCPYSFFISAHTAFTGGSTREGGALHALFNDRYVLVGTRLAGSGDITVSPVHGQLPGIFLHAMALDNLFRDHAGYWRPMPQLPGVFADVNARAAMTVALFWLLFGLNAWGFRPLRANLWKAGDYGLAASLVVIELVLVCLVLLIVSLILALGFHYAPLNWLGLLGLWVAAVAAVRREFETGSVAVRPEATQPERPRAQSVSTLATEASDA